MRSLMPGAGSAAGAAVVASFTRSNACDQQRWRGQSIASQNCWSVATSRRCAATDRADALTDHMAADSISVIASTLRRATSPGSLKSAVSSPLMWSMRSVLLSFHLRVAPARSRE